LVVRCSLIVDAIADVWPTTVAGEATDLACEPPSSPSAFSREFTFPSGKCEPPPP
jgi:hypothetical protein